MSVTVQQTEIGNYGSFFAFLHPSPKNQKKTEFLKMEKVVGDIITLQIRTENYNHMRYGS